MALSLSVQKWLVAIDADKAKLDAARPLTPQRLTLLRDTLLRDATHHANAIARAAPTPGEARLVLEGITLGGKPLRAHCEATNHREALSYIEEIVANREPLSVWQIRNLHNLVLKGGPGQEACRYRHENVTIAGATTTPPDFLDLPAELAALVDWYANAAAMHPVMRAAELHTRFVKIHPYVDGNGRTGRLLLNVELMKSGYPPVVIRSEDRRAYFDALDDACVSGDFTGITRLVAESVRRSLDIYLDALGLRVA
ncbi:filamentation induced by cAMP protein Fic [Burkholderia sp. lig30]|jgi:Fic family protein|nr:Fic family protein [Burkholderia sp. lig30]KDB06414.1 filamentation induced by cAMP protein Fic [Burkholderia sp. lig30]